MLLDTVEGATRVLVRPNLRVRGFTLVSASGSSTPPVNVGQPDTVHGSTTVSITPAAGTPTGTLDPVVGFTTVSLYFAPDLSDNPPITLALGLTGGIHVTPPDIDDLGPLVHYRESMLTVVSLPTPVIVDGRPMVPKNLGAFPVKGTAHQGSGHIRAVTPAPVGGTGGSYSNPPPVTAHPWAARWVVDDLPDPPSGGFYWLGDPSSSDGTLGTASGKRQWSPHGSTPHAPAWHSFFPYKPSVRAVNAYMPGGEVITHPKGVHFNPAFVEHMWLDFGGARRQPFTWVIAAAIASYPTPHYKHYVLDAGRNPDKVGFPRLSVAGVADDHHIHDNLSYRTLMAYSPHDQRICTRAADNGSRTVRARSVTGLNPRMLFGIYNGSRSYVGDYAAGGRRRAKGTVDNTTTQQHRYYVLGRQQGWISQDHASHLLVFEIRFWTYAMGLEELDDQYGQLSSTYKFNKYRRG